MCQNKNTKQPPTTYDHPANRIAENNSENIQKILATP